MLHACFYSICLVFLYTSWHFYAFSETNLLTSRHSASSLCFCCFCVSEKLHRKYSQNWMKQKPNIQKFSEASIEPNRWWSGAMRAPHNRAAQPSPWPCPLCVRAPRPTSDAAPSPIKTHRRRKPKYPIRIPERYRVPPPSSTRDWEGPEALPSTLSERGIATGGLLHRHACLRSNAWVVYLGLWVHSSS
jgi:hypothetical protein